MKIFAVIGMNYGDEGKGHIVDYLSGANTLNIKFNGGAQAGHAVVASDGREHIFHHFGAGTLRGARTLFASHFIVNPLLFLKELGELKELKAPIREVFIDPMCRISTPYDMLINEFASLQKGTNQTCGMGINETVERNLYRQLRIVARDLLDKSTAQLTNILKIVENEYLPFRLDQLKISVDDFKKYALDKLGNFELVDRFLEYAKWMMERSVLWESCDLIERYNAKEKGRKIIFEAGQGMLLDQRKKEHMPYLTRSNTGMKNINEILVGLKSEIELTVYLTSRTYLTRHGQGPMMNELKILPYKKVKDPTNPENPYQGKMRYGFLDLDWYDRALRETIEDIDENINSTVGISLTCVDQLDNEDEIIYSKKGKFEKHKINELSNILLISHGRKAIDVECMGNC